MQVRAPLDSLDERMLTWLASKPLRRGMRWRSRLHINTPWWAVQLQTRLNRLDLRFAAFEKTPAWAWVTFAIGLSAIIATLVVFAVSGVAVWSLGFIGMAMLVGSGGRLLSASSSGEHT